MPSLQEASNLGDLLKYEAPHRYSRDLTEIAAGQTLSLGTVLGLETSSQTLYGLNPMASDGTEVAVGILVTELRATPDIQKVLFIARHAIVSSQAIVWPEGITVSEQAVAIAQLKALGILIRTAI